MQVETYEVEEITGAAGVMAADSEAIELSERLGLTGQLAITNKDTATRLPYRLITAEEQAIYETLFPNKTPVEDYSDGLIPLRVLQVVSHCREIQMFDKGLFVWHPPAGKNDPVLVGIKSHRNPGWHFDVQQTYLLARWGDSLLPLEDLKEKARKVLIAHWTAKLKTIQASIAQHLASVDSIADSMLNGGGQKPEPSFNW